VRGGVPWRLSGRERSEARLVGISEAVLKELVLRGQGVRRVFVTGSSSGLGLMVGQLLIGEGHRVVLHGRDRRRAYAAIASAPSAEAAVVGDLACISDMRSVAGQVNRLGHFDAVIHNVGVGYREPLRVETEDGLPHVFAVNVLAPYVLTALIERPDRLIYLSSRIHCSVLANFDDLLWAKREWHAEQAYGESKLYDVLLAFAVARIWPRVRSNALEPGWVPTRMGGDHAPDAMSEAHLTQAWLAVSEESLALSTGEYFYHKALRPPNPIARDESTQSALLDACERLSKVVLSR
jgi:NAD(P)-dependent dehydrogenase (short-subunit alcohol dehydrogenase family)